MLMKKLQLKYFPTFICYTKTAVKTHKASKNLHFPKLA